MFEFLQNVCEARDKSFELNAVCSKNSLSLKSYFVQLFSGNVTTMGLLPY